MPYRAPAPQPIPQRKKRPTTVPAGARGPVGLHVHGAPDAVRPANPRSGPHTPGVRTGERPTRAWVEHRLMHPNAADELRVLGFEGANKFDRYRSSLRNAAFNARAPRAQAGTRPLPNKPLESGGFTGLTPEQTAEGRKAIGSHGVISPETVFRALGFRPTRELSAIAQHPVRFFERNRAGRDIVTGEPVPPQMQIGMIPWGGKLGGFFGKKAAETAVGAGITRRDMFANMTPAQQAEHAFITKNPEAWARQKAPHIDPLERNALRRVAAKRLGELEAAGVHAARGKQGIAPSPIQRLPVGEEPGMVVRQSLSSARRTAAEKARGISEEKGIRVARAEAAYAAAPDAATGHAAYMRALAGKYPTPVFDKLRAGDALTEADLPALYKAINAHPELQSLEKASTHEALRRAVTEGAPFRKFEIRHLATVFGPDAKLITGKSWGKTLAANLGSIWNIGKAAEASADISWPGRQGLGILAYAPRAWLKQFGPQIRSLPGRWGERYYHRAIAPIREDPEVALLMEHGLGIQELGKGAAFRPDPFVSKYVEKTPILRGSARAYTMASDTAMRGAVHKYFAAARKAGVNMEDPRELRSAARVINLLAGRGTGPWLEKALPVANVAMFAPRLAKSRVDLLNPGYGRGALGGEAITPFARRQLNIARRNLALGGAAVLGGGAYAGAKVQTDPRNADFAKLRFGNTRIDPLGGLSQYPRLLAQIGPSRLGGGKIISSTTGRVMTLGPGYGKLSRKDILERFAVSKGNPSATLLYDALTGKDFSGQPFNLKAELAQRVTPLAVQDAYDLAKGKSGSPGKALAGYGLSAVGVGVQTYGKRQPKALRELKAKSKRQDAHLARLVHAGVLPQKQKAEYREALHIYNTRNAYNSLIEQQTTDPLERERRKMDSLLVLLHKSRLLGDSEFKRYRRHYATTRLSPKELQKDRDWFWRDSGVRDMVTWYRDKTGAND